MCFEIVLKLKFDLFNHFQNDQLNFIAISKYVLEKKRSEKGKAKLVVVVVVCAKQKPDHYQVQLRLKALVHWR